MKITIINNSACTLGTVKSLLEDCGCKDHIHKKVYDSFNSKTSGNNTYYDKELFQAMLKPAFPISYVQSIKNIEDFEIETIDNKTTFGMLIWEGDGKGNFHHSTRFINQYNDLIILMDSTINKLITVYLKKLFELSPNGFTYIKLEK